MSIVSSNPFKNISSLRAEIFFILFMATFPVHKILNKYLLNVCISFWVVKELWSPETFSFTAIKWPEWCLSKNTVYLVNIKHILCEYIYRLIYFIFPPFIWEFIMVDKFGLSLREWNKSLHLTERISKTSNIFGIDVGERDMESHQCVLQVK